ncbi:MAG: hypothetical protein WAM85_03240 [Terracidiphilus sp.]
MLAPKDLFAQPSKPQTAGEIVKWWEARRLYYNLILLAALLVSILVSSARTGQLFKGDMSTAFEMLLIGLLFLQLPANIWYTGGWVADLLVKKVLRVTASGFGPWALGAGILFSLLFMGYIFFTFFPGFFNGSYAP